MGNYLWNLAKVFPDIVTKSSLTNNGDEIIRKYITRKPVEVAVEIGTHKGIASAFISQFVDKLITIDIEKQDTNLVWDYLGIKNIEYHVIADDSEKRSLLEGIDFDFAFIDGDHGKGVMTDLDICKKCDRLLFHDINRGWSWPDKALGTLPQHEILTDGWFGYWEKNLQHILFTTVLNDHYLPGFIAMMTSILEHSPNFDYEFVVFHNNELSSANQKLLYKLYNKIRFVVPDLEFYVINNKTDIKYLSLESFNLKADKVICMDSDLVCMRDLQQLVNIEPPPSHIAMTKEYNRPAYNSGVVVIQKDLLNEQIYRDLVTFNESTISDIYGHDQRILNTYFKGKIIPLGKTHNTLITEVSNLHFIYTPWVKGHDEVPSGLLALWQHYYQEGRNKLDENSKDISPIVACYKVLNEIDWLEYSLKSIYSYVDKIVIIEGCDSFMAQRANVTKEGLSSDGTTELITNFPDPDHKIKHVKLGFVDGDESLLWNAYVNELEIGDWCWTIDGDEIYPEESARQMVNLMRSGRYNTIQVHLHNLWHDFDHRIVGGGWCTIHERAFKYSEPGMHYIVLSDILLPNGVPLSRDNVHKTYENSSLFLVHLSYVRDEDKMLEKQCWQLRMYEGWDTNPKWAHHRKGFKTPEKYLRKNHIWFTGYLEQEVSVIEYTLPIDVNILLKA